MRKAAAMVIVLAVAIVLVFGTAVMSQELMRVRGAITKIDVDTLSVTIEPEGGTALTVIMSNAEAVSKFKIGDTVESRYTVEGGKNVGKRIRKVSAGCE